MMLDLLTANLSMTRPPRPSGKLGRDTLPGHLGILGSEGGHLDVH